MINYLVTIVGAIAGRQEVQVPAIDERDARDYIQFILPWATVIDVRKA